MLSVFLPEIPLSDVAGMVARGEAVMETDTEPNGEQHEEAVILAENADRAVRG